MTERTIQAVPLGNMLEADIVYSPDDGGWYADIYLLPSCKSLGVSPRGRVTDSAQAALTCARRFASNYAAEHR